MKNMRLCILALSLTTAGIVAMDQAPKKGRLSNCYYGTCKKLSNHKGKVGLVAGAVGATVFNKVFDFEIDNYVKPLIKNVWKRTCNFFRRVLKREEKA